MERELILKLLASLGIKVSKDGAEGTLKEDDAVKLIEEQFNAANRGLIQKRDELLEEVAKQKEKLTKQETTAAESTKKINDLNEQLAKNSPEENKKFYEVQLQEATEKHNQAIADLTKERDQYRNSHFERIQNDAVNEALKDIQFVDGLRDGFVSLVMSRNQFSPYEADGKTIFTNKDKKTIQAVLHEFSLTNEGKAYIKNGNQGSGAAGGENQNNSSQGNAKMTRSDFSGLSSQAQMDFIGKGGRITE